MYQIRSNVFETNSSSTHCVSICSMNEYEEWKKGNVLYYADQDRFVTREEAIDIVVRCGGSAKSSLYGWNMYSYFDFFNCTPGENFRHEYTTKNGEKLIAFGYWDSEW